MTSSQQKLLLFGSVAVIASFVVHSAVTDLSLAFFSRPPQRPQPKAPHQPPPVRVEPAIPPVSAAQAQVPTAEIPYRETHSYQVESALNRAVGVWRGQDAIQGRGICGLRFELRQHEPGIFTGYSALRCSGTGPLVTKPNAVTATINSNPEAAISTGTIQDDAVQLKVKTVTDTDSSGCVPTSFTIMKFGEGRLAAEWREDGTCTGGRLIMAKGL